MIGIFEIVFCLVAFCFMWFFVFKVMLMYNKTRLIKNINKNLEAQEGKSFEIQGRIINLGKTGKKDAGEKEVTEPVEEKPKKVKAPKKTEKPKKKVAKKPTKKKK